MRGGRRDGAGRPKGARNKRTVEVEHAMQAVAEKLREVVPDAFEGDGVAFVQSVYRNSSFPVELRLDAAAKAARFERPMLNAALVKDVMEDRIRLLEDARPSIDEAVMGISYGQECAATLTADQADKMVAHPTEPVTVRRPHLPADAVKATAAPPDGGAEAVARPAKPAPVESSVAPQPPMSSGIDSRGIFDAIRANGGDHRAPYIDE